jgi:hypothetical protein
LTPTEYAPRPPRLCPRQILQCGRPNFEAVLNPLGVDLHQSRPGGQRCAASQKEWKLVKKAVLSIDEQEPKTPLRADRPPTEGFVIIVDGHFKSNFADVEAAEASGRKLKATYPMLQIEIYDAANSVRTLLS